MAPVHQMHALLHADILRFVGRCQHEMVEHGPAHEAAISKVKSVVSLLWPRAQVKAFGSFATGLMRPGSDVDLVVTLPPVRTTTAMPQAPGELEGHNAIPKDTWQASLARCLLEQPWVLGETVRTIQSAMVPIVSFATRFNVAGGRPLRLDVSFEGTQHHGLDTNQLVMRQLAERPAIKPLTLVLKQFLAERNLDKPYLGGLSSYGLLLLVTRFLQAHQHGQTNGSGGEDEQNLGALLMALLDFYAHHFDPRNMGVAVTRNAGDGEFLLRDNESTVRVDLSQLRHGLLHAPQQHHQPGPLAMGAAGMGRARRPASEAGDWVPDQSPHHEPQGVASYRPVAAVRTLADLSSDGSSTNPYNAGGSVSGVVRTLADLRIEDGSGGGGRGGGGLMRAMSFRRAPPTVASALWTGTVDETSSWDTVSHEGQSMVSHAVSACGNARGGGGGGQLVSSASARRTTKNYWFDPLYIEDPLRPANNVGRNCFRIYAIQQEMAKGHQLLADGLGDVPAAMAGSYAILGKLLSELE